MTNERANRKGGRLAGKRVVITGGTTGLGLETARLAMAEGAKVLISGSSEKTLSAALESLGEAARGRIADVRDLAALDRLADAARSELEGVDVVMANAGIGVFAPIEQIDAAGFDRQFDVNVKGVLFTVQKMLPLMRDGGSIILTASAANGKGVAGGSIYFASKAAVRSFARCLAAELGPRGIRVNALSPGIVRTAFQARTEMPADATDDFIKMVVDQAPLGREGTTQDMANAAVFLASDESSYMTAADLVVDGGYMNV